jgi:hypothetical protein
MKHYIYRIDNDFNICKVKATNAGEAKRIVKEVTGVPMKDQTIVSKEQIEEYWMTPHTEFIGREC